jgi:chemotaxis signal transduction protein
VIIEETPAARAAALRRAFDRSFAEPPRAGTEEIEALLTLRVGGDAYAVKLADITGLVADRKIVSLPSAAPEFLGIAGLRGSTVPVWSLGALLGYSTTRQVPRWVLLVGDDASRQALGLAFEQFDGHLTIPRAAISGSPAAAPDAASPSYVEQTVRVADAQRGVLSISSITEAIRQRTAAIEGRVSLERHESETKDR